MARYALLILPAANRVYAEASVPLTVAELGVVNATVLAGRLSEIAATEIAGVGYVGFTAGELTAGDAAFLADLSSVYALFEVDGELLRPVELRRRDRFDDDLLTIQKYPGKTNEHFTKLLVNVTLLATEFAAELPGRRFRLLDPLCGRGTTLNQALMYGFDAAGVDRDQRDVEAYSTFLLTWLKRKRVKHRAESGPVRRNRQVVARRLHVTLAASKQEYRAGDTLDLTVLTVDTLAAGEYFRPASFDLLVADLPYGVQHGSRTADHGLARSPLDLLSAAVPVWTGLLRPGGALGLSWNTHVASRAEAAAVLSGAGLAVRDSGPWLGFRHRVDASIVRDVLVAAKPR